MITALKLFGISALTATSVVAISMAVYVLKQVKWESDLKRYRKGALGGVINKQGHQIFTAEELLDELMGIEERITNDKDN